MPSPAQPIRAAATESRTSVSRRAGEKLDAAKADLLIAAAALSTDVARTVMADYWELVAPEDLVDRAAGTIAETVSRHLHAGQVRPAGDLVVIVREPRAGHSGHTDIDIVTDDMPFLVDSVTAALQRTGRSIALVVHPQFNAERDSAGNLSALSSVSGSAGIAE